MEEILKELFESPKVHNVEFIFNQEEGKIIKASKCFLAQASEVWERMFSDEGLKESTEAITKIIINDADSEMFKTFLQYCYFGKIEFPQQNVLPILLIAEKYMQKENQTEGFLLQIFGKLGELEVDLESITLLNEEIRSRIKKYPTNYLSVPDVFNTLSPKIQEDIFKLFSMKSDISEITKLKRILEFGQTLLANQNLNNKVLSLSELLDPVKEYINPINLCSSGIHLLKENSVYSLDELTKFCIEIIQNKEINLKELSIAKNALENVKLENDALKKEIQTQKIIEKQSFGTQYEIDLKKVSISGDMTCGYRFSDMREKILQFNFDSGYSICKIEFEIKNYFNFSFEILYSDNSVTWKVDSIHYPSIDTQQKPEKENNYRHIFRIIEKRGHKYWQIKGGIEGSASYNGQISVFRRESGRGYY